MWTLGSESRSSSSLEVDFLNLCTNNVRSVEDLVNGGNLLNQRQCLDLSTKLSKTNLNIRELVLHCGGVVALFRPALENLYRSLEKAKLLVQNCGEKDWWVAAVFQIQNENAFQEILLDVSLCYNAIYEQAQSRSEDWNVHPEDLRQTSVFGLAMDSDIHKDQEDLQKRLEDLANEPISVMDHFLSGKGALKQCLARYLVVKLKYASEHSHANTLDTCSTILWSKQIEPPGTWGNYRLLGAGSGASGVCSTKWLSIPCAKKEFHPIEAEKFFLKEAGILAHLKHPCIVNFFCCGNGVEKGDRFIAMELMEKSLSSLIEDQKDEYFSLPVVVDMMVQMARGMNYLHEQGVAHRDLKPGNVVVNRLTYPHVLDHFCVKLVDFEMSKPKVEVFKSNTISVRGVGTTMYRAPEVHPKAHPDGKGKAVWFKADIYSFAMTCAHLLSLKIPFGDTKLSQLYEELKKGRRPELPTNCPQEIVALLRDCWDNNPLSRPSFLEICRRLETFRYKILRGLPTLDQDERLDFSIGLDFIQRKVEEKSSIQRLLMDNIEDEPENENKKNDVVSIIPCTCGRALELLPQSLYMLGCCLCNICRKAVYEEVYHCETCKFDAHPNCAEIKDEVEVFFHEDLLHLLVKDYYASNVDAICRFCKKLVQESEWVYRCKQCDFDVHALCTKYSKIVEHPNHHHKLALRECPPHKNLLCTYCNGDLRGYRYTCSLQWCEFDLHPLCAILPMNPLCIFDNAHRLFFIINPNGFHCGKCGTLGYSGSFHCQECDVDIHLDCMNDMEDEVDDWNEDYEKFMLEYGNKKDSIEMDMITRLLDKLLVTDTLEASSSSSSWPPRVTMKAQPTIQRLTSSEKPFDTFSDVNLHKKIALQIKERQVKRMVAKEARQKSNAKLLEMLENLENIVLDLQSSKNTFLVDAEVLITTLKNLKKRHSIVQEEKAMQVLSKIRQGPRIGLFCMATNSKSWKVLTSLQGDMHNVFLDLLCEESGHEHIAHDASGWELSTRMFRERWEKFQPLVDYGLQIVARAMSTSATELTELDSVKLPILGTSEWSLRAIDLEKHSKQSRNPYEAEENVETLKRAEDSAAECLLRDLEAIGVNISKIFGLHRICYIVTEEGNCPHYIQGTLAWLCTDHLNRGLRADILKSYPLPMYHNIEYDE